MAFTHEPKKLMRKCESPIEKMFYREAIKSPWYFVRRAAVYPEPQVGLGRYCMLSQHTWHQCDRHYTHTPAYGRRRCGKWCCRAAFQYRLDFGIAVPGQLYGLAIELDGKRYHKNIEKDDIRQNVIERRWRFDFIRFTGREIHQDLDQCVAQAREAFLSTLLGVRL